MSNFLFWTYGLLMILITAISVPIGGGYIISNLFGVSMKLGIFITCLLYYGSTTFLILYECHNAGDKYGRKQDE